MGDLISRSALMKKSFVLEGHRVVSYLDVIEAPTAYNVGAVVAELEEAKKKNFESYKEAPDTLEIICYGNVVNAYGNAISVVKAGGVE